MNSVQTVLGLINPGELGATLMHEHVFSKFAWLARTGETDSNPTKQGPPVKLQQFGLLRKDPSHSIENIRPSHENILTDELGLFKALGGGTIVDVTPIGRIGRNLTGLRRIASKSRLNIIASTGWYMKDTFPPYVERKNAEELCDIMVGELTSGIDGSEIRCGIIGEIGCSEPALPVEVKIMRAVANAQIETRAAVTTHPALPTDKGLLTELKVSHWYIDVLEREGADVSKLYIGHADRTCRYADYQRKLLDRGVTLAYDTFGHDHFAMTAYSKIGGRCDGERTQGIVELCKLGYDRQIVLSHDICYKMDLKTYGGFGFGHILSEIVPALRIQGVTKKQIRRMLIENPRRLLTS